MDTSSYETGRVVTVRYRALTNGSETSLAYGYAPEVVIFRIPPRVQVTRAQDVPAEPPPPRHRWSDTHEPPKKLTSPAVNARHGFADAPRLPCYRSTRVR